MTGVQTCALPIYESKVRDKGEGRATSASDDEEKCDSEREGDMVYEAKVWTILGT